MSPSLPLVALLLLLTAACGAEQADSGPPVEMPTLETLVYADALGVDIAASTRTTSGLYFRDLAVGDGAEVVPGRSVTVRYAGFLTDGRPFDATGEGDPPFVFTPGRGEVIAGWDEGLLGMRVGGRRQLILPPELGYGERGAGAIPPNAILVFTVEVVSVQ